MAAEFPTVSVKIEDGRPTDGVYEVEVWDDDYLGRFSDKVKKKNGLCGEYQQAVRINTAIFVARIKDWEGCNGVECTPENKRKFREKFRELALEILNEADQIYAKQEQDAWGN